MNLDIKTTGILIENNLRIYFYSISMDCISVFMSWPYCFDYSSFVIKFEIRTAYKNVSLFIAVPEICKLFTQKDMEIEKEIQWLCRFAFIVSILEVMG